jgi:hypothetical protein
LDWEVVGRARQEVFQFLGEVRIGEPSVAVLEERVPGQRRRSGRQREQLGNRAPAHGHSEAFAVLDPTEHRAHVVAKVACRDVRHNPSVASLLRKVASSPEPTIAAVIAR